MPLLCRYCWGAFQPEEPSWTLETQPQSPAPSDPRAGARGFGYFLAIWLLPGTALCIQLPFTEPKSTNHSRPYLLVVGPPALRFQEALEPQPDLSTRPPAGAPPHPIGKAATVATREEPRRGEPPALSPASAAPPQDPAPAPAPDGSPSPAAILPDEIRPKVRPEDFLPYFQFPQSGANPEDVSSVPTPPVPGKQPPSTATYRQQ